MTSMRKLELLAPAKNLECGIAAIDCGADAVYIGAARFGARAAAGNSVEDIAALCRYAHVFGARVYVTLNTIIYDSELADTLALAERLRQAGVDAILVQDMGLVGRVALPLHASTQCDTRTADKALWLRSLGFSRVVLARELSADEIQAIHQAAPDLELEVFVHGALCVSYSGVCYASQYCFGRSANRGECAQFCRLKFDLVDADGREIEHQRHLLSLRDLCQIDALEQLADAGACSFKIEGRLKDADYVKNVVAAYSRRLDQLVASRPNDYCRASRGRVEYHFEPNLHKTFNRGYTHYFLNGRQPDIASFDTPKAMGEYVGRVKELRGNSFSVAGVADFANGDGLCFINADHELEGFRVNRAEGNRLYPQKMPPMLRPGMALYRNSDVAFSKVMAGRVAERKVPVDMTLSLSPTGFVLQAQQARAEVAFDHQEARTSQHDNIVRQLSKLGNTPYTLGHLTIADGVDGLFIPSSLLSDLRRQLIEQLQQTAPDAPGEAPAVCPQPGDAPLSRGWQREYLQYPYLYNIANQSARAFYQQRGLSPLAPAYELSPTSRPLIMQCRHCLRYALGYCVRHGGRKPQWREPLYLRLGDGRRFELKFQCDECQMNIYAEE